VQTDLTHDGLLVVGSGELKKGAYEQGLMFDQLNRTGFRILLFQNPSEGKGFALSASQEWRRDAVFRPKSGR
jgi:hypothetical protein